MSGDLVATPVSLRSIASYHAHIYFKDQGERDKAALLREWISSRFVVQIGNWHDKTVGPHDRAMYQIAFDTDQFARLVPWLMLNRMGLTILLHPNTKNPRADHLTHALWMGEILPIIRPEQLPDAVTDMRDAEISPNTAPHLTE
ncbi:MAG: DOPA 4,5-dioxygenase family protein [Acidocella sp.]|nr:DOPA 4,5-dioxygenase family protein [Acidocella sp.]